MSEILRLRWTLRLSAVAMLFATGCTARHADTAEAVTATKPRVYSFHPMEDGIPAKGHSMTYLIVGEEGAVLVDPGRGTAHDEVMAFIRSHDLEPKDVKWALLTHAHLDHTGGAHLVQDEGIPVACSDFTAMAVREAEIDMICKKKHHPEVVCHVDRVLKDGDVLNVGNIRVETVEIPGHTAGCLCFLVETEEGRTVFTGDLIRHTGHSGWTGSRSYSYEDSIRSVERLLALEPDKAYWGHGHVDEPAQEWLQNSLELDARGKWVMD